VTRLEYQTIARCEPEHVWHVFADIDNWSKWNPVIGKSKWVSGEPWTLGSQFFMQILQPRRMTFTPVINEISAPNRVAWTGNSPGFEGTHWHEFIQQPDGTTLVKTWEEFSGFATLFFTANMKKKLLEMYRRWLESLSREAEKLAQARNSRTLA
jgi:hypothetical protein